MSGNVAGGDAVNQTIGATGAGPSFKLRGGKYLFGAVAASWGSGTISLQVLGPDGATYLAITRSGLTGPAASLSANGSLTDIEMPPGQYQIVNSAATGAASAYVAGIPD